MSKKSASPSVDLVGLCVFYSVIIDNINLALVFTEPLFYSYLICAGISSNMLTYNTCNRVLISKAGYVN